ncbi:type II toxin-antitoxin system Phd/YefM family antitoxin [Kitasatospora sp. NPDC058046]|uniref:type II toxin-antitoxin system Phd/YefM family antitoxin n=1 Tax=Kitasatospora sp. NPDC058046 TaxID=3346312 RepID=UPI0036DF2210
MNTPKPPTPAPTQISTSQLRVGLADVLRRLAEGEAFELTRQRTPVATITPLAELTPGPVPTELERQFATTLRGIARVCAALNRHGYTTLQQVRTATDNDLLAIRDVGPAALQIIREVTGGGSR